MVRGNFADLYAPGFRKIFFQKFGERSPEYTEIFNINSSKRQYEDDSYVSGFGLVPVKTEGATVTYDDAIQGFDKRYTHTTKSLAYRITKEAQEDELYGVMKKLPAALGRSMRITVEQTGANVLNRAFNNSYTGGDGKELCATDHPLVGGGTQKNEPTNPAELDAAALEQAFIDIAATTDDRGLLLHLIPKKIITGPELDYTTQILLKTSQEPGSANNDINPSKGSLTQHVNHFITDAKYWFIFCDEHEVNWFWRIKPSHEMSNDFDTDDAKGKVRARWSEGWSIPWGVYGSPGD
jgi:phage major head subunit gpT-like protein